MLDSHLGRIVSRTLDDVKADTIFYRGCKLAIIAAILRRLQVLWALRLL